MTIETKVEAVAWRDPDGDIWPTYRGANYYCTGDEKPEPLYSQRALDALRGEVAAAYAAVESKAGWEWKRRAEEAERRVAELEATLSRKDEIIRGLVSSPARNAYRSQGGHSGDQGDEPSNYGGFGRSE